MKILVTGATGFLGSHLTRRLIEDGADVRILQRSSSSHDLLGSAADKVERVVGDVLDAGSLDEALEGITHIYHMAGKVGFASRLRDSVYQVNVDGTANVVDAARRANVERLVFTSSMAAFGRSENPRDLIDETAEWRESSINTAYAHSKHLAELEVQRAVAEGLDAVIVNPALIFGPGRMRQNTRAIVESIRDRSIPFVPPGGSSVVDVRDVVAGHRLAMQRGGTGERYYLGSENLSWRAIFTTIAEALGTRPPRYVLPAWVARNFDFLIVGAAKLRGMADYISQETVRMTSYTYRYDNSKAVNELGCTFRPFTETMAFVASELRDESRHVDLQE